MDHKLKIESTILSKKELEDLAKQLSKKFGFECEITSSKEDVNQSPQDFSVH